MDIHTSRNAHVLDYLLSRKHTLIEHPPFALPNSVQDPYRRLGAHPEVVQYLWDKIGKAMPAECRGIVYGTPALLHPLTGVIFALTIGTAYGLRLPGNLGRDATRKGVQTQKKRTYGGDMDIPQDLGAEWVFGIWKEEELDWCKAVYEQLGKDPGNLDVS